jgi:Legionella pneumophila major outer membrane protein precursor
MEHMAAFNRVSGSVLAMTAAGALPAVAQDTGHGFTLDVKAGYGITSPFLVDKIGKDDSTEEFIDKVGLDDDIGFTGSARIKGTINPVWDYSFALSGNLLSDTNDKTGDTGSDSFRSEIEDRFDTLAFDADVGWNTTMGATPLRVFGGIRAFRSSGSTSFDIRSGGDWIDIDKMGDFSGYGPRIGMETGNRFSGSNFGWNAALSGSALFGTVESSLEVDSSGGPSGSEDESEDETVYNIDASLGVDWYLNNGSKVTVGYQLQKFWNVYDERFVDDNDKLIHGAYLGYTTSF